MGKCGTFTVDIGQTRTLCVVLAPVGVCLRSRLEGSEDAKMKGKVSVKGMLSELT